MPFENETFDFLLCRAAFKNFAEPFRFPSGFQFGDFGGGAAEDKEQIMERMISASCQRYFRGKLWA